MRPISDIYLHAIKERYIHILTLDSLSEDERYSLIKYFNVARYSFCLEYRIFEDHEFANIVRKRMGQIVTVDHKTNIRFSYKYNCSIL